MEVFLTNWIVHFWLMKIVNKVYDFCLSVYNLQIPSNELRACSNQNFSNFIHFLRKIMLYRKKNIIGLRRCVQGITVYVCYIVVPLFINSCKLEFVPSVSLLSSNAPSNSKQFCNENLLYESVDESFLA